MRVVVTITGAYPELRDELNRFNARDRAERMRFLAALGQKVLLMGNIGDGIGTPRSSSMIEGSLSLGEGSELSGKRERIKNRLSGSLA